MSDLKEIYKIIFDFFKIYKASSSLNVSKWKLVDLNNSLKWADSIEEIYNKIKNRKYFKSFLEQIKCIKEHWNIDDIEICEDLLKNASDSIKKSLIKNKNLPEDLKNAIMESIYNNIKKQNDDELSKLSKQNQEVELNEQYSKLFEQELDKICIKLCYSDYNTHLIDSLLEFTINHNKNLEFLARLISKLKKLSYQKYTALILRILNKKYEKVLLYEDLLNILKLEDDQNLLEAYFCYLFYIYSEVTDGLKDKDINDPANQKTDNYDLIKLIDYFENLIVKSNNTYFLRIIQKNAQTNASWNFLLNQLKLRYLKETDEQLFKQIQFIDEEFLID